MNDNIENTSHPTSWNPIEGTPPFSYGNAVVFGLFLWTLCFLLALLEVQIEGANGWAAQLPTWRSFDPRITWIFGGKPITGYHVYLNLLLLTFFHFPLVMTGFSWRKETRLLSAYIILTVVWDFLWFVVNPHFGMTKYDPTHIWWFRHWALGFPVDYFVGIISSFFIMIAPGFRCKRIIKKNARLWAIQFGILITMTVLTLLMY